MCIHTRYSVLTAASAASCCSSCWSSSSASARQWTDSHGFHLSFSARQWADSLVLLHPLQGNAQTLSETRSLNIASCRRSVKLSLQLHAACCHRQTYYLGSSCMCCCKCAMQCRAQSQYVCLCQVRALLHPSRIIAMPGNSDGKLHAMKTSNMFSMLIQACCVTQLAEQHPKAAQHAPGEP